MSCARNCGVCVACLSAHPAGKTCNDCVHVYRCKALIGIKGTEDHCDWYPTRAAFPIAEADTIAETTSATSTIGGAPR